MLLKRGSKVMGENGIRIFHHLQFILFRHPTMLDAISIKLINGAKKFWFEIEKDQSKAPFIK